jgi:hypothetical protein
MDYSHFRRALTSWALSWYRRFTPLPKQVSSLSASSAESTGNEAKIAEIACNARLAHEASKA